MNEVVPCGTTWLLCLPDATRRNLPILARDGLTFGIGPDSVNRPVMNVEFRVAPS